MVEVTSESAGRANVACRTPSARPSTLHDVAARVGVSPRTVSRVVNDEGGFSAATRKRVLAAIEELEYLPNLVARGLVTQRTRTLGLVVTDICDPFFAEVASGAQRAATANRHNVFLCTTHNEADQQAEVLASLRSHGIDGTIVFPVPGTENELRRVATDVPIVCVDHEVDDPRIGTVSSDLVEGARQAVAHLVERGHRRLAMVASKFSPTHRRRREAGFLGACRELLGDGPEPIVLREEPTLEGGRRAAAAILDSDPSITAIFAYNDIVAIGAVSAAKDCGLDVPGDLAVVGFDDIPLAGFFSPQLTTVRIDRERLGGAAVDMVLKMRDEQASHPDPAILPVELVVRRST